MAAVSARGRGRRPRDGATGAAERDGPPAREKFIDELKRKGLHFRNEMETGPGGKQVQLEDPDGNPLELFEPEGKAN